ncbi:hypothetical protein MTO96_024315 [Rhipicephalus appendiculatus]
MRTECAMASGTRPVRTGIDSLLKQPFFYLLSAASNRPAESISLDRYRLPRIGDQCDTSMDAQALPPRHASRMRPRTP